MGFTNNSPTPIKEDNSIETPKKYAVHTVVNVPKIL